MSVTSSTPNTGQQAAADAFLQFLMSSDKEFRISGAAGTGKTFLMNYLVETTIARYHDLCALLGVKPIYTEVMMTATTNKAADVLSQAINKPVQTVHSFFNLKVQEDYSTGRTLLKKTDRWVVHTNKVIVVDEASMIDTDLWRMLDEGTLNCKLVYVGDHNQLAPVMEDLSPVYKHNTNFYELTEQMRNVGQPALMALCQQLRETVQTGEFKPIRAVPGVIDWLDDANMEAGIAHYFGQQTTSARILAFTNKRVNQFNDHIRSLRHLPPAYQEDELLVVNNAFQKGKSFLPVETQVRVASHGLQNQELVLNEGKPDQEARLMVSYLTLRGGEHGAGDTWHDVPYALDRNHLDALVKYYAKVKNWTTYFYLKNQIADLRPRDAATVHKSQGSTYDTVFVDLGNISTCNITNQVARMLYVAMSRARNRVFLYGQLADKYGGVII